MLIYRIGWHDGFGGTHTAETATPKQFIHDLGHVDWLEIFGAYQADKPDSQVPQLLN